MQYSRRHKFSPSFCVWFLTLFLYFPLLAQAELKSSLESPVANETVAGIATIRGWAFDTSASVQVSSIELFVDDVARGSIACCTNRLDVQAAFPSDTNAGNSGFGLTINWGELSAGSHS